MPKSAKQYKILFAVGGTGGHLFPAQALARELKEKEIEIFFGGGRLATNRFFHSQDFPFEEITSASPFRTNPFKALLELGKGIRQGLQLFKKFPPDLVIGFGSFYSFPLLAAARLKNVPYILINTDVLLGKVNRLFAKKALLSIVQFEESKIRIKGKSRQAKIPVWSQGKEPLSPAKAREYYHLDPECFTLLVFGGSQGASPINLAAAGIQLPFPFQVIHLCGHYENGEKIASLYKERGILAIVKPFEEKMQIAWSGADLVICRSGAGTLTEMIQFKVPAIFVPWPKAADGHQLENAKAVAALGGGLIVEESQLSLLGGKIQEAKEKLEEMKEALHKFDRLPIRTELSSIIIEHLL